jgi:OHCU decarboxylase
VELHDLSRQLIRSFAGIHLIDGRDHMQFRLGNAALALVAGAMLCGFAAVAAAEPDINAINAMDRTAFVQKFGGIFEKSPWVAEKVSEKRPFASIDDLHAAMVNIVKPISPARKPRPGR